MPKKAKIALAIVGIIAAATLLFFFNPEKAVWMPKCPFYLLTGLQCPSCGSTRAVHNLLHFNWLNALRYNPFIIISIPYAIALLYLVIFDRESKALRLRKICFSKITVGTYIILFVLWWVLRNCPPIKAFLLC